MSLKGIDTSKWQAGLNDKAINADFIIFKATEGVGYVDSDCAPSYAEAKAAGKLLGVYHFARPDGNDPISEAEFFVDNVHGYIGEAILVLDWETEPKGNVAWAKQWLDHVFVLTGVHPLIYMSASTVNEYDWSSVSSDYALWVARYWDMATDVNYDMSNAGPLPDVNWPNGYTMWQWTSRGRLNGYDGDLDCNIFYGSGDNWRAFARNRPVEVRPPVEPPVITPVEPPVMTPVEPPVIIPVETPVITPTEPINTPKENTMSYSEADQKALVIATKSAQDEAALIAADPAVQDITGSLSARTKLLVYLIGDSLIGAAIIIPGIAVAFNIGTLTQVTALAGVCAAAGGFILTMFGIYKSGK